MRVRLGPVAHFSLAVRDPKASAAWWTSNFDLDEKLRSDHRILLGNPSIVISLFEGNPDPDALGHLAFRASDLTGLELARDSLRANGVDLEDPATKSAPLLKVRRVWACGFTTPTTTGGSSTCKFRWTSALRWYPRLQRDRI